jgi:enoyl-[acyl-carrier protein] reductase I
MVDLSKRRGLVVGVSTENSFGHHCARALVNLGAEIIATSRRGDRGRALAESAGCARHLALDCDDEASIDAAFAEVASVWGRLDFLVHTIMAAPSGVLKRPLVDLSKGDFERVLSAGTYSLIGLCRRALPLFARSTAPRVVTFTFAGSQQMAPNYHAAGICKAALEASVRYLAYELGPKGVLVNAISTSMIATDLVLGEWGAEVAEKTQALIRKRAPTRSAVGFDAVTSAAAWLVSEELKQVTGEVLMVDGGFSKTYV